MLTTMLLGLALAEDPEFPGTREAGELEKETMTTMITIVAALI